MLQQFMILYLSFFAYTTILCDFFDLPRPSKAVVELPPANVCKNFIVNHNYGGDNTKVSAGLTKRLERLEEIQNNHGVDYDLLVEKIWPQVGRLFSYRIREGITNETLVALSTQINDDLYDKMVTDLRGLVSQEVNKTLQEALETQILETLSGTLQSTIEDKVEGIMASNLYQPLLDGGKALNRISDVYPLKIENTKIIRDCSEAVSPKDPKSGVYYIRPVGAKQNYPVYCEVTDAGIFTYLQQRVNGSTNFNRNWAEYKNGFGKIRKDTNFYVGNELIHLITSQRQYSLRVDLMNFDKESRFAFYFDFSLSSEKEGYVITVMKHTGSAGDMLSYHNGMRFTTFDKDHDMTSGNCAEPQGGGGGWWYKSCFYSNLNGRYHNVDKGEIVKDDSGLNWRDEGLKRSEKRVAMKIMYPFSD